MLIQVGYDEYKFWNVGTNKIEVASSTLKLLNLDFKFKYFFKSYDEILFMISEKTGISKEKLINEYKSNTEGFN